MCTVTNSLSFHLSESVLILPLFSPPHPFILVEYHLGIKIAGLSFSLFIDLKSQSGVSGLRCSGGEVRPVVFVGAYAMWSFGLIFLATFKIFLFIFSCKQFGYVVPWYGFSSFCSGFVTFLQYVNLYLSLSLGNFQPLLLKKNFPSPILFAHSGVPVTCMLTFWYYPADHKTFFFSMFLPLFFRFCNFCYQNHYFSVISNLLNLDSEYF